MRRPHVLDDLLHPRIVIGKGPGRIDDIRDVGGDHVLLELVDHGHFVIGHGLKGGRANAHLPDARANQVLDDGYCGRKDLKLVAQLWLLWEENARIAERDVATIEARGHGKVAAV